MQHLTRAGRHFKPLHLEEDHLGREVDKGKGKAIDVPQKEDEVLMQLKKTQANISIWGLLMSSRNHM